MKKILSFVSVLFLIPPPTALGAGDLLIKIQREEGTFWSLQITEAQWTLDSGDGETTQFPIGGCNKKDTAAFMQTLTTLMEKSVVYKVPREDLAEQIFFIEDKKNVVFRYSPLGDFLQQIPRKIKLLALNAKASCEFISSQ
jgi:hypothetical protein